MRNQTLAAVCIFLLFNVAFVASASEIDDIIAKWQNEMSINVTQKPVQPAQQSDMGFDSQRIVDPAPATSPLSDEERDIMKQMNAALEEGNNALMNELNEKLRQMQSGGTQEIAQLEKSRIEFGPLQVSAPFESGVEPLWHDFEDFPVNTVGARNPSMAVRPSNGDLWVIVQNEDTPTTDLIGYVTPDNGRTWWWMFTYYRGNLTEPSALITNSDDGENLHIVFKMEKNYIGYFNISLSNWPTWREGIIESSSYNLESPKITTINSDYYYAPWLIAAYTKYDPIGGVYVNASIERSTDGGVTWTKTEEFPDATGGKIDITYSNNTAYAAYDRVYTSPPYDKEIYFRNSTSWGFSWSTARNIAGSTRDEYDPSVAATLGDQDVIVAYTDRVIGNDSDIRYAYSTNKGYTWSGYRTLANSNYNENSVDLAVDPYQGKVHAAYTWYYRVNYSWAYHDSLFSFSQPQTISNYYAFNRPSIAVNPDKLPDGAAIAWTDFRDYWTNGGYYSVYFDAAYLQPYSTLVVDNTFPYCAVGNGTYSSIQSAVDAAANGDTVLVCPGTYAENVNVLKNIYIRSYTQNPADTKVIALDPAKYIFNVDSATVEISGFNITNASARGNIGVYLFNSAYSNIRNNWFINDYHGVNILDSYGVTVYNNTMRGSYEAIQSHLSDSNYIARNDLSLNTIGVTVSLSNYSDVGNNEIFDNSYGVMLNQERYVYVYGNKINRSSFDGINLQNSQNNTIYSNFVNRSVRYGIYMDSLSDGNVIYNNYYDNSNNARDLGTNRWNITKTLWWYNIIGGPYWGGNYWSDYRGLDLDADGIGETLLPFTSNGYILNGGDYLPLTKGGLCYDYTNGWWMTPPPYGDWTVSHRIECNDVIINMNGNLDINGPGGNLSFNNVTLKMNATKMGEYSINVNSGGAFFVNSRKGAGSLITNGMNASVFYTFKVNRNSTFQMRNSTVKYAGTGYVLPDYSNDGLWIDADGVILDNNTFTENHFDGLYLNRSDNSKITNNRIYSNKWNGIRGITVNNLVVAGNEIYSNKWTGIALDTSANSNISKNNIHDNSYDGISVGNAPNIIVNNNTVKSNNNNGIVLSYATFGSVQSNNISFNLNDGIVIGSSSSANVKYNRVLNNSDVGIILGSSPLSNIIQNTVNNNGEGVYISDSLKVVSDKNTVINNRWYGIHLYLSHSNILSRNIVNQTNKELASSAVYLSNSTFSTINDNGVYDNLNGIQLWYSSDASISNNNVSLTKGDLKSTALYLSNSPRGKVAGNNVSDNWDGIVLWESPNALLTNNVMLTNSNNGIKIQNSGVSNITWNSARSNSAGISVISSNYVYVNNNTANSGYSGISISSSDYGSINDNIASNNGYGISLGSSNYHDLNNNTARNNAYGISLSSSSRNNITNSIADLNNFGLYMTWSSNNNKVIHNNFSISPNYGGFVFKSNYNNISDNNLQKSGMGLHLEESNYNDILINDARWSTNYGIDLYISNNNNISSNDARYSRNVGVGLSSSDGNLINDTLAEDNSIGVSLRWSDNNIIENNTARLDDVGIDMFNSGGNILNGNNVSNNNNQGVRISNSNSNIVTNNKILSNVIGLYFEFSPSNNIRQNTINQNNLDGLVLAYMSDSNTVLDNTINTNGNISIDVHSSNNNIIENNSAMYSDIGIFVAWSKNNILRRNTVNNNDISGILLEWLSDNNIITDNKASNNNVGLSFTRSSNNIAENNMLNQNNVSTNIEWSSNNNILRNNTMRSNNYGVSVAWSSENNTLTGNWIDSNARLGLYLRDSDKNIIFNNYIANSDNVWDNGANKWNISKTVGVNIIGGSYLGGNYWSDYSGKDLDGDRLGDTKLPYNNNITIGGDYHPLTLLESVLPLVYVAPDYQKASVGSNFTVTIEVNPLGNNVYAASYNLSFDATKLEVLTQTKGPFLTRDGANSTVVINNIDNTNGILSYAETRVGTLTGTNIADTIATVKFRVKSGSGNTSLTITQAELTDPTPEVIPSITKNGLVDIGGSQPVANCGPDKLKCENVGTPVQFNGSASYDPDGTIVNYAWNFGDGTTGSGISPTHKYTTYNWNGTAYTPFTVMLTVTDNSGLTNTDNQLVAIWITGDATGDGRVNIIDAATVGVRWGSADPCADLNNDGKANIVDAAIVGLNWGRTA